MASTSFSVSGTAGADEIVVPWVFAANASGHQDVVLYGEDITDSVTADYHINLNIPVSDLNGVFAYTQPEINADPTALSLTFSSLTHAFDASFVSSSVESVTDDAASNVMTPYGQFRNYITTLASWTGLHARDDSIKSESDSHTCDHLLGAETVVHLSNASFDGPLAAVYERAAAAGKINASGAVNVTQNWELQSNDKVTVYVKFTENHSIDYEFDTTASGSLDASFSATALSGLTDITVYYGGAGTSVQIQDDSQEITKVYKLTLTAQ
jgi:hypothetical protein